MSARGILFIVIVLVGGSVGCVQPLPRYDWVSRDDALTAMNHRADKIKTISASGRLTLSQADGKIAQLDCAIAYQKPDWFRLRAWKFSQAVLDFTVQGDDVWIIAPDRNTDLGKKNESNLQNSLSADHMMTSWSLVVGGYSPTHWAPCVTSQPDTFTLCGKEGTEFEGVVCEVDRDTLTTQSCYAQNDEGNELFHLLLRRYRIIGGVVLPTRIRASYAGNTFTWLLDEIEINEPLAPRAFVPPRRAVKQP